MSWLISSFFDDVTDWLMVIITFVYVVATIFICIANINSANATKEQISLSEAQFREAQRIGMLPCFNVDINMAPKSGYCMQMDITPYLNGPVVLFLKQLSFCNIGNGIAKNVHIFFSMDYLKRTEIMTVPMLPVKPDDGEIINMAFTADLDAASCKENVVKGEIVFEYEDLMDYRYKQTVLVEFVFSEKKDEAPELLEKKVFAPELT